MSLGPYNPMRHIEAMRRELDRLWPEGIGSLFNKSEEGIGFPLDLHETENEIVATCNLPGIEHQDDLRIDVENNVLSISGVLQKATDINENHIHRQERYYGRFQRSVALPSPVDADNVKAAYRNGVLEIRIPKQREEPKRRINIDFS